MKKFLFTFLLLFLAFQAFSQDVVSGTVMNAADDKPIEKVHIVNLNQVKGAVINWKKWF